MLNTPILVKMRTHSLLALIVALLAFTTTATAGHSEELLAEGNVWRTMRYVLDEVPAFPDIIGSPMLDGNRVTATEYYYGGETFIDGIRYYDMACDTELRERNNKERARLIAKMLKEKKKGGKTQAPKKKEQRLYHCDSMEGEQQHEHHAH